MTPRPHRELPSSPQPVPTPSPRAGPVGFSQPHALHRGAPTVLGAASAAPGLWPKAGPSPAGPSEASSKRARGGEGARALSEILGQGVGQAWEVANEAHGLGGRQRPKSWPRKGAGGLRRRHSPHCRRAPAPYPSPAESGSGTGVLRGLTL